VSLDVRAAVGLDLDQAGPGSQRVGETIGSSPAKGIAAALGIAVSELAKAAERLEG